MVNRPGGLFIIRAITLIDRVIGFDNGAGAGGQRRTPGHGRRAIGRIRIVKRLLHLGWWWHIVRRNRTDVAVSAG